MRILLIGANGQVGRETRRRAPAHDVTVTAVTREGIDLGDLTDEAAQTLVRGHDACINAAAYTAVDQAEDEPELAMAINATAPAALARACARAGIPLVHYSTDYVFDGKKADPYTENDPTNPQGVYGQSKREGEEAVLSAGGTAAVIRLAWVFSPYGKNFVKTMLRLGEEHGKVRVVDDQRGTPTPAGAAAEAGLVAAAQMSENAGAAGLYHYAGAAPASWADFARAIFEAAGRDVPVTPITTDAFPTRAKRPASSVLDSTKFHRTFGLAPADWRAALADVMRDIQAS